MFKNFILVVLAVTTFARPTWGEDQVAEDVSESLVVEEEEAPPPEPPYPGAEEGQFAADKSAVKNNEVPEFPRPIKIDDEGTYYYGTKVPLPVPSNRPGITQPKATAADGEYKYSVDSEPPTPVAHPGIEQPVSTTARGDYLYQVEASPTQGAASFRFGALSPPKLQNKHNGVKFDQIYSDTYLPTLFLDYDWRLFSSFGRLSLKIGSGLTVASGQGRFKDPSRLNETPVESFTFVLFPNQLTAAYKFQFADRQFLVPFVEGGGGYFTYAEIRDDAKRPKFGATPVGIAAGGVNILLDWFDPIAIRSLDADYGINHLWLTAEVRQIVGLRSDFDFSSTSVNAGFLVEF